MGNIRLGGPNVIVQIVSGEHMPKFRVALICSTQQ